MEPVTPTPARPDLPPTVLTVAQAAGLPVAIAAGDFIADTLRPFICGFVTAVRTSQALTVYTVRTVLGRQTIYGANARLIALSDDHQAAVLADLAAVPGYTEAAK